MNGGPPLAASSNGRGGHTLDELISGPPPAAVEAERALLGAALLDADAASIAASMPPDAWYVRSHLVIAEAVAELDREGEAIDALTVHDMLDRQGTIDDAGGYPGLTGILSDAPSTTNALSYAAIIREKYRLRLVARACLRAVEAAYASDIRSALGHLNHAVDATTTDSDELGDVPALLDSYLDMLTDREEGRSNAIPTGWPDLDDFIGGLYPGNLITFGARTSHGKTASACSLALNLATAGKRVLYVSLEMPWNELLERWLGNEAKVDTRHLRRGTLSAGEWGRITQALKRLSELRIKPAESRTTTVPAIRAEARAYKADVVIVDYLQLVHSVGRRNTNRENEVAEVSRSLKGMGLALRIPVVALAQLNRGVEARAEKRPELHDLRDTGQIEQDSDVVIGAYRPVLHDKEADPGEFEFHVLKNRHGERGVAYMTFQAAWQAVVSQYRPPERRSA